MTTLLALFLALVVTPSQPQAPVRLEFREILAPSTTELKPSDKLRSLQGKRVRMIGYMAEMEQMPEGYFYLCARPVLCDESGGGIGELPIDAVRVIVPALKGKAVKFVAPPIFVTGILELSGQSEFEPDSWAVRVLVDKLSDATQPSKNSSRKIRKQSKR